MQPKALALLEAILDEAKAIVDWSNSRSLWDFEHDRLLREGIYWNFAMIGENPAKLKEVDLSALGGINDYQKIIRFRNQAIHGYVAIKHDVTWYIIKEHLPVLIADVERLLKS